MEQFLNKLVDFATHAGLKLVIAVLVLFLCSKGISLLIRRLKKAARGWHTWTRRCAPFSSVP